MYFLKMYDLPIIHKSGDAKFWKVYNNPYKIWNLMQFSLGFIF